MHIALLTGGISAERPVALRSAENMENWIRKTEHTSDTFDLPSDIDRFLSSYRAYDLVIPMFHGRYGEDGIITGMCETIGIPVAYSSSSTHALCIDKYRTNCVVEKLGAKVPKSWVPGLPEPHKLLPRDAGKTLDTALIVKPNQWGSSVATSRAITAEELRLGIQAVNEAVDLTIAPALSFSHETETPFIRKFPFLQDTPIVQECIEGREFTVGVYRDAPGTRVLPIVEIIILKHDFFDYEEKYESDGSNEVFAEIEKDLEAILEETSIKIYDFLGCRGIVRIDYRYDGKDIYFLEVNTIPGFTSGSLVPKMWKKAGKTEKEFIEMLALR